MRGSSSDRSSSSSSLTRYLDQFIRGAGEGRWIRRREKIRWWKRQSIPKGQDVDETDVTDGQWGLEHTDQPTGLDRSPGNVQDGDRALSSVEAHETVPLPPLIYGAPRYSSSQHQLVRRASASDNAPLIIGAAVGGLCFVGVLIIAIVVWRRRLRAKERQIMEGNKGGRWGGRTLSVITSPTVVNRAGDKLVDLGTMYRSPASAYRAGASRSSSVNNKTRSTPTSPIDKTHIRHHSWTQAGSILGSPTEPAIAGVQIGNRIPSRGTTRQSVVSSPSSIGKRPKRTSSVLQRFGHSRELSAPGSITTSLQSSSTNRGPPPPRPPRPDEENGAEERPQIFELSASPSVRVKGNNKALPALPTFLVREHEEEMKRRREEWERERERERTDQYESQRRPQSLVDDSRSSTRQQPGGSSAYPGGSGEMGMLANQEELALKKVMSLESLASTATSSSSDCGDEDEAPAGSRRPIPEVNALSPRSSQRRPARPESGSRPPIPSFANTESESIATGDSLMKRTSYLIADGSSGVEATAVARGFPSPKLGEQLRLTPPLPSSASTSSSNISSVFGLITAPVSATAPKPLILPPPDQSRDGSLGAHIRAESTSSGGIAAPGGHQETRGTFMLAGDCGERGLAFSSIEDWRESVGETYAGTRPTTAGAASTGPASAEDMIRPGLPVPPVMIESAAGGLAQPRPAFPRRISVDTGVGGMNIYPPPPVATAGGALLTPRTAASTTAQSLFTPIEMVPVSAVTPPSGGKLKGRGPETLLLRPSTPERERALKNEVEGVSKAPKPALKADEGAHSWLNVGEDSDSDS
ncbi:hypothetical protein BGX38DRAFT_512226 [Terfezia claveryi]|nr:hypothetical protein BGX38DRAFT_512226 [Terfezia claveryi]